MNTEKQIKLGISHTVGSLITMASFAFALLMSMAQQVSAQPSVAVMPSYSQSRTYANAALNEPIAVWGRTWGGVAPYTYDLDFGDGNSTSGAVGNPNEISSLHTYTSGGSKTFSLTVTDNNGDATTRTGVIRVLVNPTKDERINMAIEKGLLYIYRNQLAVNLHGSVGAYWQRGYGNEYGIGELGAVLAAFGENGHHANNDDVEDIYAQTIRKAVHTLTTARSGFYNFTSHNDGNGNDPYNDLDGDHRGVYLYAGGHETYANAFGALGLVVSHPDLTDANNTTVSGGNLNGLTIFEVVQDVVDLFSHAQGDGGSRGGWVYNNRTTNNGYDGSTQQWPNLVFKASEDLWGLSPQQWVKDNVAHGFRVLQNGNGGIGYRSSGGWVNTGKTGGGLVGYNVAGLTTADSEVTNALTYISNNWRTNNSDPGWAGSFYHMYGLKKGLQLTGVETVNVPGIGAVSWYEDLSDWLMGYGPATLWTAAHSLNWGFGQYPDGHWQDSSWIGGGGIGTAHAILILTQAVTIPLPVAIIDPVSIQPRNFVFQMDGSDSFHLDSNLDLVLYEWDFDYDGSTFDVNASSTGSLISNPGYALPGSYTVALRVTDNNPEGANSDLATTVVEVTDQNAPPVAVPIPSGQPAYSGRVGDILTLDGTSSFDPEGDPIVEYLWDLDGNGTFGDQADADLDLAGDANTATPQVTFTTIYNGLVALKVTSEDEDGIRKSSSNKAEIDIIFSPSNLLVTDISASIIVPGEEANITVTVANAADSGQGYTGVVLRFYSSDPFLGGSVVGPSILVDLPIGGSKEIGPINLTGLGGADEVFAFIDANSAIGEYNESDNADFVPVSNTPPVLVLNPEGFSADADGDCQAVITASQLAAGTSDPDGDDLTITADPAGPYGLGATVVTVTVTDGKETVSGSITVTVTDTVPPVLTIPADVVLDCPADTSVAAIGAAIAVDNCSVNVTYDDVVTASCGSTYTVVRTWTATDGSNNSISGVQTILVQDITAPTLVGVPADVTVECDAVPAVASVSATDACDTPSLVYDEVKTDGTCVGSYTLTRTWTATDACGNVTVATQVVTVEDRTAPVIASDAADITPADVPVTFQIAASDNCDVALAVTYSAAKTNPQGKVTDKTADTIVEFEQADSGLINVTIVDAGGNGNVITFVATATDGCNTTITTYTVNVVSPSSSEANEGVGNGVDGNTPGHDNNGGNDDPGNTPGNPGAKGKKK